MLTCEAVKTKIAEYKSEKKGIMLGTLAADFSVTELEIAKHLPADMATMGKAEDFEAIWDAISKWDKAMFLMQHMGTVVEFSGKMASGTPARGYFNLKGSESNLHGHLKVDDLDGIAFLSMPYMTMLSLSIQFFNKEGQVKFAVYVGRENREHISTVKESFMHLKNTYCTKS